MERHMIRFGAIAGLLVILLHVPVTVGAQAVGSTAWFGMYMNDVKIGHTWIRVSRDGSRGALKTESRSVVSLEMMGTRVKQDARSVTYTDANARPTRQTFAIDSQGSRMEVAAKFGAKSVVVTVRSGGSPSSRTIPIPRGARLAGDSSLLTQGRSVKVGLKDTVYYLNPVTLTLDKATLLVEGLDTVTLSGHTSQAFRVSAMTPLGRLVSWETSSGRLLKGDMPLGIVMVAQPEADATSPSSEAPRFAVVGRTDASRSYTPPRDFAIATAVAPDRKIDSPRALRSLTLRIAGVPAGVSIPSDGRQKAVRSAGAAGVYRIETNVASSGAVRMKIADAAKGAAGFVGPGAYLDVTNREIAATARALTDPTRTVLATAHRIQEWVHKQMRPDYSIGVPRSASDIFRKRRGVCRDYATLFAGIARAAGIPTRLAGGLVYADDRFFYHAWAEVWAGEWVSFDPTIGGDFVDATHIKLAHGDAPQMYNIVNVIGRIKIEVVSPPMR